MSLSLPDRTVTRHLEPGVYARSEPSGDPAPVIFDSPHSGADYPADFEFVCPFQLLRHAEDAHVDALFSDAPRLGATLIAALFPRSYIDVNRGLEDIDPALLAESWPGPLSGSDRVRVGMGLVRRVCKPGLALYGRKLSLAEVRHRIDRYYRPYHAVLAEAISDANVRFGAVWHLNCHSMPSSPGPGVLPGGWERTDFVLGDRDGTTCAPGFRRMVQAALERMGYDVRINDPYKGVELVRRFGKPRAGRHSLQIEINRRLYMNETTMEPSAGFAELKRNLSALTAEIVAYAGDQLMGAAAD